MQDLLIKIILKLQEKKDFINRRSYKFHEGITLSYAEKIIEEKEIELISLLAYLSDTNNERSFILYYYPKVSEDKNQISRAIVIHGRLLLLFMNFIKMELEI